MTLKPRPRVPFRPVSSLWACPACSPTLLLWMCPPRRAVQVKAVLETALTEADAPLVVADLKRDTGRPRTVGAPVLIKQAQQ